MTKDLKNLIEEAMKEYEGLPWSAAHQTTDHFIKEKIKQAYLAGQQAERERILRRAKDHYWDSLISEEDIVMLHLKSIINDAHH